MASVFDTVVAAGIWYVLHMLNSCVEWHLQAAHGLYNTRDWRYGQQGISNYLMVYEEFDDLGSVGKCLKLKDYSIAFWRSIISQLIHMQKIFIESYFTK